MDHEFFENLYLDTVPGDHSLFTLDPKNLDMSRWFLNEGCFSRIDPLPEPMAQALEGVQMPIAVKVRGFSNNEDEWNNDLSKSFVVSCYPDAQGHLILQQNMGFGLEMSIAESMRAFFMERLKTKLKKTISSISRLYLEAYPDFEYFMRVDLRYLYDSTLKPLYPIKVLDDMVKTQALIHQIMDLLTGSLFTPMDQWKMKWSERICGREYFFFCRCIPYLDEYEAEEEAIELMISRESIQDISLCNNRRFEKIPEMSPLEWEETSRKLRERKPDEHIVEHHEYFSFNALVVNEVFSVLSKMEEQGLELWIPSNVESLVEHSKPFLQWQKDFFETKVDEIACSMRKRASIEFAGSTIEYKYTSKQFLIPMGQSVVPYTLYSRI